MRRITDFHGLLRFTPVHGKCDPITVPGHWTLKNIGKPWLVWCDRNLYKNGIKESICEIIRVDRVIKEESK